MSVRHLALLVRMPASLHRRVARAAKAEDRSMASWVRQAIIERLEQDNN